MDIIITTVGNYISTIRKWKAAHEGSIRSHLASSSHTAQAVTTTLAIQFSNKNGALWIKWDKANWHTASGSRGQQRNNINDYTFLMQNTQLLDTIQVIADLNKQKKIWPWYIQKQYSNTVTEMQIPRIFAQPTIAHVQTFSTSRMSHMD